MTNADPIGDETQTTWHDVQAEVLRRIRSGEWPAGETIPGEIDLAREFDCARATIGRALRALAEDGLLDRRRRAGTRVVAQPVRRATLSIPVIRQEVESRGSGYRAVLLERTETPAPAPVAARMGLAPGTPLLHLRTLHMADGRAHCYEDRWADPAVVPGLAKADLGTLSANEWLVRNTWYSDGEIAFQAESAGAVEAELLGTAAGAPLFVLDRITRMGERPITWVRLVYPPGYRVTTSL